MPNYSSNKMNVDDEPIHRWYRFVLAYPPHLVRHYIDDFGLNSSSTVLDPFCGTGTTNIECMKNGIPSIGIEANSMTYYASKVKSTPINDIELFVKEAEKIRTKTAEKIKRGERRELSPDQYGLLLKGSIDDKILSDVLLLKETIIEESSTNKDHFLLTMATVTVYSLSNLKFSPEISVVKQKTTEADVPNIWFEAIRTVVEDYNQYQKAYETTCNIINGDSRDIENMGIDRKIDAIITSPPYPNEKDYSRTTRLETVLLGFANNKMEMRGIKKKLLRSNTKNIYKGDEDYKYVMKYPEIVELSEQIEKRRIELDRNSGFERLYHKVFLNYFGGMARHLISLKPFLNNGAKLAYVVGDQGSYYKIPVKTAELLSIIAEDIGYKVERIDVFRTRYATGSGEYLNENVLILSYGE